MSRGPKADMELVQTDVSRDGRICQAVVESIAKAEGTEPTELNPPLEEVIDPATLESFIANNQTLGKIMFNYDRHEVSIFTDGYVSVKSHRI